MEMFWAIAAYVVLAGLLLLPPLVVSRVAHAARQRPR